MPICPWETLSTRHFDDMLAQIGSEIEFAKGLLAPPAALPYDHKSWRLLPLLNQGAPDLDQKRMILARCDRGDRLLLNWFGDSFDGSLARYRAAERLRYGFRSTTPLIWFQPRSS
jgi:hypothetical protein